MDKKENEEDLFNFHGRSSSNLKNLFDEDFPDDIEPNQNSNRLPEPTAWNLVTPPEVVTAFKNSSPSGRVGIALLTNPEYEFKIVIYRNKSNVLGTFTLQEAHLYRRSSYLQFYDDSGSYWSVLFDPGKENDFLKKIPKNYACVKDVKNDDKSKETLTAVESDEKVPKAEKKQQATEVTSDDSPKKDDLLLRVAKMGQPLPKLPPVSSDVSDSSDTEVIKSPLPESHSKIVATRKLQKFSNTEINPQTCITANVFSTPAHIPLQQDSHFMNMILCENRTQNTELRMNISKLELKIEKILDKMDSMNATGGASSSGAVALPVAVKKEDEILQLEEAVLELKKENRKLRQLSLPSNEPTVFAFLDKHLEKLQKLGIPSSESDKIEEHFEKILIELLEKIDQQQIDLAEKQKHYENCEKEKNEMRLKYEKSLDEVIELKGSFLNQSEKCEKLNIELADAELKLKSDNKLDIVIKDIMNRLYGHIYDELMKTSTANFSADQVLRFLGSAIRRETMEAINMAKTSNIKYK